MNRKPRNIATSQTLTALAMLVVLFVGNVVAQIIWLILYGIADFFRDAFPDTGHYEEYMPHFITPIFVALLVAVIYTIFAQSPIGVNILKNNLGVRPVMTEDEKSRLEPIHDEVFESIREKFPNAIKRQLYIFDSADINAFCMNAGSDIAIHRGSTQTFNDEELKALIAHEYGHSYYKDGLISTLFVGAQYGFIFLFIWPFIDEFKVFYYIVGSGNIFSWALLVILIAIFIKFYMFLVKILMLPLIWATRIVLSIFGTDMTTLASKMMEYGRLLYIQNVAYMLMSKQQEYRADEFACYIGYKYGMESVLRMFHEMEYQPLFGVLNKVFAEHPATYKRIANVEKFEVEDY